MCDSGGQRCDMGGDNVASQVEPVKSMAAEEGNPGIIVGSENNSDQRRKEEHRSRPKKSRALIWTDELHRKFLGVVEQLGLEKAVPRKVHELMNVEGLRRENVASHLQKYRLRIKRTTG